MVNLLELLTTHVPRTKPTPTDTNQQFSRVAEGGRIIRSYSGFLPRTRRTARHILRCEHLWDIPGERLPYRVDPSFTHQIWIWYRLNKDPEKLYLLFRGQFNFTITGHDSDWIAGQVSDSLASLLRDSKEHMHLVFRHKDCDTFWALAVERKFKSLSNSLRK